MSKGEWKRRKEQVHIGPHTPNSASLWVIDLSGPMSRSDGGKPPQGMNMPAILEEKDPPTVIGTVGAKRLDGLKLIGFQIATQIKH